MRDFLGYGKHPPRVAWPGLAIYSVLKLAGPISSLISTRVYRSSGRVSRVRSSSFAGHISGQQLVR